MAVSEKIWKEQAERIEQLLGHFNVRSIRSLALDLGMNPSQLNRIAKGLNGLPMNRAEQIGEKYGVDYNWLLKGTGNVPEWYIEQNPNSNKTSNSYKSGYVDNNDAIQNIKKRSIDFTPFETGRIIKKVREVLELSQTVMGQRIGISKDLLLKVEKGHRSVTLLTWVLTLNYLNNMPEADYKKVKFIYEEDFLSTVEEDEGDYEYKQKFQNDQLAELLKKIEFLQSVVDHQKTLIEQKDFLIKQLQSLHQID
jgi:transcriptional regulator with XRE-family HTH domain